MLGHFPAPYPGELIYSVLARLCARLRFPNQKSAMRELFGSTNAQAVVDLPCNLEALAASLPPSHRLTAETMINAHTLFPLYGPFLSPQCRGQVRAEMLADGGGNIHLRTGIMAARVRPPETLRLCPACDRENIASYGESYWQRLFQVAGVEVCPVHSVFLERAPARRRHRATRHVFTPAQPHPGSPRLLRASNPAHAALLRLAKAASWLLDHPDLCPGFGHIHNGYRALLIEAELASGSGRVRWPELLGSLDDAYPPVLLELLQCAGDERGKLPWLERLVRSPRAAQSPIRHLILIDLLGLDVATFFARLEHHTEIFGEGPWPCLNPVCSYFNEKVVKCCAIEHGAGRKRPVGVFACPHCAYTYCRYKPGLAGTGSGSDWVRDHGPVWRGELARCWNNPAMSLRAIARRLVVEPLTIKRWALDAGLPFPRKGARLAQRPSLPHRTKPAADGELPELIRQARNAWLTALTNAPRSNLKMLRAQHPALYARLYRHDRTWLNSHRPIIQRLPISAGPCAAWLERDGILAAQVHSAAARLRLVVGEPRRVSAAAIGRQVGALAWLQKHLDKIPLTHRALATSVETRAAFARRRIKYVVALFLEEQVCPPRWQFVRRAGLRPDLEHAPEVATALAAALSTLHYRLAPLSRAA